MTYPDKWSVLRINYNGEILYKVLASFYGGYLYGNSWRLNSGITKVEMDGDYINFHGYSGSVYSCHKDAYGMNMVAAEIYHDLKEKYDVVCMDETTNWIVDLAPLEERETKSNGD